MQETHKYFDNDFLQLELISFFCVTFAFVVFINEFFYPHGRQENDKKIHTYTLQNVLWASKEQFVIFVSTLHLRNLTRLFRIWENYSM